MTAIPAQRTPQDLAGCGWYEILSPPPPARELDADICADWIIVGAGFAGLAAARRLSQLRPGERIVVLEAQRVGWGAAGRNSGFMIDLPHELNSATYAGSADADRQQIRQNRAALEFARTAVEEYGLHQMFSACGKYHGAANSNGLGQLNAYCRHLDALHEPYSRLDAAAMQGITGSEFYLGGIHTPGCALIQPAAFVRGLATALSKQVELYENSPVLRLESGRMHTAYTPRGRVSAPCLILTVNGHAESFGLYRKRLLHIFTYASMTRPLTLAERETLGGATEWGLIPADPMGTTLRRTRDHRILVRNTFTYNPGMTTSEVQVRRIGQVHDQSFRARFPMLDGVTMEYRWGGHLCLSRNATSGFGEVREHLYTAVCQNGLGTVKGTLAGMLIAELASGGNHPLLAEMLAAPQPKALPPEPFTGIGVRTTLWWKQRRALRER